MKKISILLLAILFYTNTNAQTFELLDSNNVSIEGKTHYIYGVKPFRKIYFNIKNLTGSTQEFGVKITLEYTPNSSSGLAVIYKVSGHIADAYVYTPQIMTDTDVITANSNYAEKFRVEPFTNTWADCPNDSAIWRVTIFNQADITDTTTARIIYKCSEAPLSTGIGNISVNNDIKIYPNPTNGLLNFNTKIKGRLYNILGKEVLYVNNKSNIDISYLTKGIYFLNVNGSVKRIVKE